MAALVPEDRRFITGVEGSDAILPAPPPYWSYSSLKEVEACPRRYVLTRAAYPDLGYERGYPQLPFVPALLGDIVHDTLEVIVTELVAAGCESMKSPEALGVLKKMGGFSAVVEQSVRKKLDGIDQNPRVTAQRRSRLVRELRDAVDDGRARVQEYLSRARFSPRQARGKMGEGKFSESKRRVAAVGPNAELTLIDEQLRLTGRVDLIDVNLEGAVILDYKTGAEDPGHIGQLQLYALLWDLDRIVNPTSVPAAALVAAYSNHDVKVDAPSLSELRELEERTRLRIATADSLVAAEAPSANPSVENCGLCPVRHLCAVYWTTVCPDPSTLKDGDWLDFEGVVGEVNGVRSRWMLHPATGKRQILLQTTPNSQALKEGSRVRILGLVRGSNPETSDLTATMAANAEAFQLSTKFE